MLLKHTSPTVSTFRKLLENVLKDFLRRVEGKGALVYFIYTAIDCDDLLGPELKNMEPFQVLTMVDGWDPSYSGGNYFVCAYGQAANKGHDQALYVFGQFL